MSQSGAGGYNITTTIMLVLFILLVIAWRAC
ncbi:sporulation protein YjcZ [Cohnella cholangitidis]|uniref:Sporulation protein YjcZ n=1 Tax=Cohnella cholangitidis TaxID=2598458 RepID=A0A7G5BVC9_9BACL|nr:sporulation protein YjcZ [Cohnella cholangitidis]